MTSASARLLTQGWSGEQRRQLRDILDPQQRSIIINRINLQPYEAEERVAAIEFINGGEPAYGIVEYEAASLFGRDPTFQAAWRAIRAGQQVSAASQNTPVVANAPGLGKTAIAERTPKLTIRDQVIRGLERLGYTRDTNAKTTKYTVFNDKGGYKRKIYVGKVNTLRIGVTVAGSIVSNRLWNQAMEAGLHPVWPIPEAK